MEDPKQKRPQPLREDVNENARPEQDYLEYLEGIGTRLAFHWYVCKSRLVDLVNRRAPGATRTVIKVNGRTDKTGKLVFVGVLCE